MSFLKVFDDSAEKQAYLQAIDKVPALAAGSIVVSLLGLAVGLLALTGHPSAVSAGLAWSVLTVVLGAIQWRMGLRQHAKNRWLLGAVVGLLVFQLWT